MRIIAGPKGVGKTAELIRLSSENWQYILCLDKQRARQIDHQANVLGLLIPFPITVAELDGMHSRTRKPLLIDDFEEVLVRLLGQEIDVVTTSSKVHFLI